MFFCKDIHRTISAKKETLLKQIILQLYHLFFINDLRSTKHFSIYLFITNIFLEEIISIKYSTI